MLIIFFKTNINEFYFEIVSLNFIKINMNEFYFEIMLLNFIETSINKFHFNNTIEFKLSYLSNDNINGHCY